MSAEQALRKIVGSFPGTTMIRHGAYCALTEDPLKNCTCGAQRRVDRKVLEQIPSSFLSDAVKFKSRIKQLTEEVHSIAGDAVMGGKLDSKALEEACAKMHGLIRDFEKGSRKVDDRQTELFTHIPKGKKRTRT